MNQSLTLATFFGIPVKVHWSFALLIAFVVYTSISNDMDTESSIWFAAYVMILFLCVVFHEFGHALVAARYGVKTKDIILSPIGGVARLERLPEKPSEELAIAFAGPMVNIVIAGLLSIILWIAGQTIFEGEGSFLEISNGMEFIKYLVWMNLALFIFNLVPAFPMDGGRILRSLLAMKWGRVTATRIASYIGRGLAVLFVVYGLLNEQFTLALIGFFIYTMAGAEFQRTKMEGILEEVSVGDIMRSTFTRLHLSDPFSIPIDLMRRNIESNFLIFDSLGYVSGALPEQFIMEVMKSGDTERSVNQFMSNRFAFVDRNASVKEVFELMNTKGMAIVAVGEEGAIEGVVDRLSVQRILKTQG